MVMTIVGGIGLGLVLIVLADIVLVTGMHRVCNDTECQGLFWNESSQFDELSQGDFEESDFDKMLDQNS